MQSGGISFAACAAGSVAAYTRMYQLAATRHSPPVTLGYSRRAARLWRLESCHWMGRRTGLPRVGPRRSCLLPVATPMNQRMMVANAHQPHLRLAPRPRKSVSRASFAPLFLTCL